ncbi:hypothetical protein KC19_7G117300 [Ceratodon purpureus]|uniref:Uncharacterized protein n=1 Tax=Ceratodon purpureus TaxID=3225 RepID=A0A8T0GWD1_CERPU|nr:hypothetical protein KC19_N043500 [Ceratodon purpureus]KAG0504338.1 hypothetical protein KC19_N041300 [Ceratodon purpureus]KAG0555108.1 hypothetical protein KC19_12G144800 [Ceratodon purpureus]KAG0562847.1 hypothetical protein KC19_9G175900 [Ceratodon purpureus]KAG0567186.1 hypothetical protein KC19_7G117300 [Ceratodon purpureus]
MLIQVVGELLIGHGHPPQGACGRIFSVDFHFFAVLQQVSEPFDRTESYLKCAEQRYKGFLYLFTLNEGLFLVPTDDVDIMW